MGRTQDEVAILVGRGQGAVAEWAGVNKARHVGGTGGWHGTTGRRGRRRGLRVCQRAREKQNGDKGRTGQMHGIALKAS
jgi:hypothetical protein